MVVPCSYCDGLCLLFRNYGTLCFPYLRLMWRVFAFCRQVLRVNIQLVEVLFGMRGPVELFCQNLLCKISMPMLLPASTLLSSRLSRSALCNSREVVRFHWYSDASDGRGNPQAAGSSLFDTVPNKVFFVECVWEFLAIERSVTKVSQLFW